MRKAGQAAAGGVYTLTCITKQFEWVTHCQVAIATGLTGLQSEAAVSTMMYYYCDCGYTAAAHFLLKWYIEVYSYI